MRTVARISGALALVVALAAVGIVAAQWAGVLPYELPALPTSGVLVVAAGSDEAGAPSGDLAVIVGGDGSVTPVDVDAPGAVDGMPLTGRQALAYGGGHAFSLAVRDQIGADGVVWIVLPATVWHDTVDQAGGVRVDVPRSTVAFDGAEVTSVDSGLVELSGQQAGAVAASLDTWPADEAKAAYAGLARAVGGALAKDDAFAAKEAVRTGQAASSLPAWAIGFMGVLQ